MRPRTTFFRRPNGKTATIGIVGDMDFSTWQDVGANPLDRLKPLFSQTDIVVANVETVISDRHLNSCKKGILLKSPTKTAKILKESGIDLALLANNHIDDFGLDGVHDTVSHLQNVGIECFGLVETNGICREVNGLRFVFAGFGTTWQDISIVPAYGTSPGAISANVNVQVNDGGQLLYFVHGFEELYSVPFPWRVELLNTIADVVRPAVVVCGHSHVYQGWFERNGIPVCLGYGNGFMNLAYHPKANPDSKIGCYSILRFDNVGCFAVDEYLYLITPTRVEELSDGDSDMFWERQAAIHLLLGDNEKLDNAWEEECFKAWMPKGFKSWPILWRLYDWHRKIRHDFMEQNGVVYVRAMRAAYLKKRYGLDVFRLRDDEKIRVAD